VVNGPFATKMQSTQPLDDGVKNKRIQLWANSLGTKPEALKNLRSIKSRSRKSENWFARMGPELSARQSGLLTMVN
jgi:hypothetical protein